MPPSLHRPPWPYVLVICILLLLIFAFFPSSTTSNLSLTDASSRLSSYLPFTSSSSTQSSPPYDPDDPLSYRRFLERTTSPARQTTHSPTFTFERIYVLSLPSREDRRDQMRRLAKALGVEFTFVDAANKDEMFIQWIGERVMESREERKKVMGEARGVEPDTIGGLSIGSDWLTPYPSPSSLDPFPSFPVDDRYPTGNWVTHLESLHSLSQHTSLAPSNSSFNLSEALWDPHERQKVRQVHEGIISTYWGQTRALKEVIKNGDKSALILEDDVDVEWDVERLWSRMEDKLPEEWDVTFLGHCWGHEILTPWYLHPLVHHSVSPMCLHGWAVTSTGASRIMSHLLNPWSAFSTAVDLVLPTLIHYSLLSAFSIQPPLIIQRKDGPSDLQKGNGSKWRGVLRDSTVERLSRDEGSWKEDWEAEREMVGWDPATVFREDLRCENP